MKMLTGWKPISNYMGVSVQTAKKWHKLKGLPVFRGPNNVPISFADTIREWVIQVDGQKKCPPKLRGRSSEFE